ncbi:MAG TPA: IS607 family element RNA-guided endonuclease TnpB, partial [Acidimicrobiales bacterium]|nr:IS607 family element RNA-guided endonuclease TnpB [Acidimicrobiales bacterium]
ASHRQAVESVSILFGCYERRGAELVEVPSGWRLSSASFEVEWPKDPEAASLIRSHFGARRFAYNWALSRVKADLDEKSADPGHESTAWTSAALRKVWNAEKDTAAPWWAANSKESYASGITDLARALHNWRASKAGRRKGRPVGFPRFCSRHNDHGRVRFTTGTLRLEADRRHLTLPVVGALRSKEHTGRLQRRVAKRDARVLNMTLSERWGRLFVSVNYAERVRAPQPSAKAARCGIDLGLRTLATVAGSDGRLHEFENPAPFRATLSERRRVGREMSRRIAGSRGHRRANAKLARLDRRAVHLRREQWHQLTHRLVREYHEVVVEDLDLMAMKKSMGRRAFRRSVSDAALGMFRPLLGYKLEREGGRLVVADRFFASSQLHHGCGCRLVGTTKLAKQLVCQVSGELVERDVNAALNLRDWPGHASPGSVGAGVPVVSSSGGSTRDAGSDPEATRGRERPCQTGAPVVSAVAGETRTDPDPPGRVRNPERGAA